MYEFFNSQIGIFLIYLLAGVAICLLYDVFRALRKTVKTPDVVTYIEDAVFWVIVAVFLIYLIFILNLGEIRFFMFLAICLGGVAYYFTFEQSLYENFSTYINFCKINNKKDYYYITNTFEIVFKNK